MTTTPAPSPAAEASTKLAELQGNRGWADRLLRGDPAALTEFHHLSERIAGVPPGTASSSEAAPSAGKELFSTASASEYLFAPDAEAKIPLMVGTSSADAFTPSMTPREQLRDIQGWRERGFEDDRIREMRDPDRAYPQWLHEQARRVKAKIFGDPELTRRVFSGGDEARQLNAANVVLTGRVLPNGTKSRWTPPGFENPF